MLVDTLIQVILYLTAVINAILSIVVLSRGFREYKNIIFGLFTSTAVAWTLAIIGFYYPPIDTWSINWVALTHSFALLTSVLFFYFSLVFPQNLIKKRAYTLFIPFFILVYFISVIATSNLVVGDTHGISYELGPLFLLYSLTLSAGFFAGYYFLFRQFKNAANATQKKQVLYVVIGGVLSPILAIIPTLILPYIGVYGYTWTGPIFTLIMVFFIFAAMVRLHLFNIKIIVTEVFATLIIIVLLAQLFIAETPLELFITTAVLIAVSISAFLLIRSVQKEVEQREEIERLAQSLEKANKRLKELDTLKSQFLSIASHDLRAPLTAIRNFMSILLEGTYGKLPAAAEEGTKQVFERATDMAEMVDNYLNVSRIEQGRMKYDFADINFAETLNKTLKAFEPVAQEKGLTLTYKPVTDALPMHADESKLREVVENLINNAINYTPQGSISVTIEKLGTSVRITFQDTGIGMSQATIGKLFGLFSPGEDSRKYNPKSTGVGLYITKAHVEAHKGTIRAESDGAGKGSRFIVELPL